MLLGVFGVVGVLEQAQSHQQRSEGLGGLVVQLTCEPAALLLLGLEDQAGELLHLLPAQFELSDHLVEGVDQAVKAVVGYLAQRDVHVLRSTAHLVYGGLQPIQWGEGALQDPVVDDKADGNAA